MDGSELKRYERFKEEAQFLQSQTRHLQRELDTYRPAWYRASVRIDTLEQRVVKLTAENKLLRQKVKDLTLAATSCASLPEVNDKAASGIKPVKPSVAWRRRRGPGRRQGHRAALQPMPDHIDVHQKVPLATDAAGHDSCPCCSTRLLELEDHERVVEDIIPLEGGGQVLSHAQRFLPVVPQACGVAGARATPGGQHSARSAGCECVGCSDDVADRASVAVPPGHGGIFEPVCGIRIWMAPTTPPSVR